MIKDKLKINDDKTQFILIGTRPQLQKVMIDSLVDGDSVVPSGFEPIKNLGAWFHSHLTMNTHILKTCKAGFYYLYNISRIRKFLSRETTETLIHAFVTSRLDYYNSLLYGLPNGLFHKLQHLQNSATRLIFRAPRYCHITPLLIELHWLIIKHRICFKIILITYKALHDTAPKYIRELTTLKPNSSYGLRSNDICSNLWQLKCCPPSETEPLPLRLLDCEMDYLWNSGRNTVLTFLNGNSRLLFKRAYLK